MTRQPTHNILMGKIQETCKEIQRDEQNERLNGELNAYAYALQLIEMSFAEANWVVAEVEKLLAEFPNLDQFPNIVLGLMIWDMKRALERFEYH